MIVLSLAAKPLKMSNFITVAVCLMLSSVKDLGIQTIEGSFISALGLKAVETMNSRGYMITNPRPNRIRNLKMGHTAPMMRLFLL